jgi:glycerol-3-phosphate dehydrogenase
VVEITRGPDGFADGVIAVDSESGQRMKIAAHVVVNAAGIFADQVRRLAEPEVDAMIAPSQGIHLVFKREFLRGNTAIMVPHTSDGRVLFAIPWHEHTVVGTTDTAIQEPSYNPLPFEEEIQFILDTAALYLSRPPQRSDVLSVYVGIRPLVKANGASSKTSSLSRDHTIHIDNSGLLTIVGGKWTTYRHMAEDTVNHAITLGELPDVPSKTHDLKIHGYKQEESLTSLGVYGSDGDVIMAMAAADKRLGAQLHPALPYIAAEVIWAVREEMARTLDDVLSRRTRALFLNARAAIEMAPSVAALMAQELGAGQEWIDQQLREFNDLAAKYLLP